MTRGRRGAERSDCDNACGFWNGAWDPACEGGVFQSFCFMQHVSLLGSELGHSSVAASAPAPTMPRHLDSQELAKLDDMTKRRETPAGETESSPGKTATYDFFCAGATHARGEAEEHLCLMEKSHLISFIRPIQ